MSLKCNPSPAPPPAHLLARWDFTSTDFLFSRKTGGAHLESWVLGRSRRGAPGSTGSGQPLHIFQRITTRFAHGGRKKKTLNILEHFLAEGTYTSWQYPISLGSSVSSIHGAFERSRCLGLGHMEARREGEGQKRESMTGSNSYSRELTASPSPIYSTGARSGTEQHCACQ